MLSTDFAQTDFFSLFTWFFLETSGRYVLIAGIAFLLTYVLFKNRLKTKIQANLPLAKDYKREIGYSILTSLIFGLILVLTFLIFKDQLALKDKITIHQLYFQPLWLILMAFLHDTYFYWTHRAMHHPRLFKLFHLTHHRSTNPTPWAAYAFSPLEAIVEGGIVPVIAFTVPAHKVTFFLFLFIQLIVNVYGHTGYELFGKKFHKRKLGKWINTSVAHNMHHKYFRGNYSLYFLIWDRIMGTLHKNYDEQYEKVYSDTN